MWAVQVIVTVLLATAKNSLAFSPSGKSNRRMDLPSATGLSPPSFHLPPSSSLKLSAVYADEALDSLTDDESMRAAYDKWRAKYNKGPFDETRFENFKRNYVTLMRANTAALRKANELGLKLPSLMSLNEYADYSVDEFKAVRNGQTPPGDSSDFEGTQQSNGIQSYDSSSKLWEQKGEVEPEPDRVRKAYLNWCEEFGKTVEEERFEVFRSHFLAIEKHCLETGKEMKLNAWADFTPQEFVRAQGVVHSTATTKRSNKLSDPEFLRSRTKDVMPTGFSTESTLEAKPTNIAPEGVSTGNIGSSYLDSMSSSSTPKDDLGTQPDESFQEEKQKPSFLDSLSSLVGEEPPNLQEPPCDTESETKNDASTRSEPEGFDYASYADSLSKSSSSKDEDTSQRSYIDAIAMQQNPANPLAPEETSFTMDLDEQAKSWESFNQGGSDEVKVGTGYSFLAACTADKHLVGSHFSDLQLRHRRVRIHRAMTSRRRRQRSRLSPFQTRPRLLK